MFEFFCLKRKKKSLKVLTSISIFDILNERSSMGV